MNNDERTPTAFGMVSDSSRTTMDEQIFNKRVKKFKQTEGHPTCCSMMMAVTVKRWQVFCREKRQWLLTFSPFVNIINLVFIIEGFKTLILVSRHFDNVQSSAEKADKANGFRVRGDVLLDVAIGFAFPLIMNYGFASCAGMFMLMPLEDRECRTK